MNQITEEQLPPPPQPPQPHRNSTSCDRHPDESFTGFCPSCLCERLAVLDSQSSASSAAVGRKSASSALKSLFKPSNNNNSSDLRGRPSTSSFLPELRRTKSFSAGRNDGGFLGFSGGFEPQRKSCDVRGRSTLFSLFNQDDGKRHHGIIIKNNTTSHPVNNSYSSSVTAGGGSKCGQENSSVVIEFDSEGRDHVAEVSAVEEVAEEEEEEEEEEFHDSNDNGGGGEIQVVQEKDEFHYNYNNEGDKVKSEIKEEVSLDSERAVDLKTMKDYIDIDSGNKKGGGGGGKDLKELAGSFWSAASVFSKKLRAWTKKNHKLKKHNGCHTVQMSGKKGVAGRKCRDTQSEIADYGFGRRSCDTDPRFSLDAGRFSVDVGPGRYSVDAGRMSFDDPRGSFDEPRASWDGYLIGRTGFPRMIPPMVSVVEDAPVVVSRKDMQIPVEEQPRRSSVSISGDDGALPGGAAQTKDYYSDSSSKRRKSLDRSSSIRKTAAAVVAEMDEMKNGCNGAKAEPACLDYLNVPKLVGNDRDLRDSREFNSNPNSLRDDYSGSFDMGFRDNASVIGNGDRKGSKKSRRWRAWNIWGLLYRRSNTKDEEDDRYNRANGVERSLSESWQDYRRDGYGDPRAAFARNALRSNSSVSWRNSYNMGGSFGSSIRQGSIEVNSQGRKKREEFVFERNRSARYSPNHADNGMLRLYLTPMKGSRRGGSGKAKPAYSHSFARSMLRLY